MRSAYRCLVLLLLLGLSSASGVEGDTGTPSGHSPRGRGLLPDACAARSPLEGGGESVVACAFELAGNTAEPTIGIDPRDGSIYVFPLFDSAADSTQTAPLPTYTEPRMARTRDGGSSWSEVAPTIGGARHPYTLDPYLYVDPATGRIFANSLDYQCSFLSFSDDGGATWTGGAGGCGQFDRATIFAGEPVSSDTIGYPRLVYYCAMNVGGASPYARAATCAKSLDGGLTFVLAGEPAFLPNDGSGSFGVPTLCGMATGHGAAGPDGTIYLAKGICGEPWFAASHDEGLTWTRHRIPGPPLAVSYEHYDQAINLAVDATGRAYAVWLGIDHLPYLATSADHGATWTPPQRVAAPGVNEASLPTLAVRGPGEVAIVYYGTTTSPAVHPRFDYVEDPALLVEVIQNTYPYPSYRGVTWDAYATWADDALGAEPTWRSVTVNEPTTALVRGECQPTRCQDVFDFIDVDIAADGSIWASLVDDCRDACEAGAEDGPGNRPLVGRVVGAFGG